VVLRLGREEGSAGRGEGGTEKRTKGREREEAKFPSAPKGKKKRGLNYQEKARRFRTWGGKKLRQGEKRAGRTHFTKERKKGDRAFQRIQMVTEKITNNPAAHKEERKRNRP